MYLNVICLKCGKAIPFKSVVPYSVDKISDGWNLVTDETNGEIISIRGSEIASICSQDVDKIEANTKDERQDKAAQIAAKHGKKAFNAKITKK